MCGCTATAIGCAPTRSSGTARPARSIATGNIAVINPEGDVAYGDSIELTDSLKDGVVENMLVVLEQGGRLAAQRGTRAATASITLDDAAYTPCAVTDVRAAAPRSRRGRSPRSRSSIDPTSERIYYTGRAARPVRPAVDPAAGLLASDRRRSATAACWRPISATTASTASSSRMPYYFRARAQSRPDGHAACLHQRAADAAGRLSRADEQRRLSASPAMAPYSRRSDDLLTGDRRPTARTARSAAISTASARFQLDPQLERQRLAAARHRPHLPAPLRYLARRSAAHTVELERIDHDSYFVDRRLGGPDAARSATARACSRSRCPRSTIAGASTDRLARRHARAAGQQPGDHPHRRPGYAARLRQRAPGTCSKLTALGPGSHASPPLRAATSINANDTLATTVASYRGDDGLPGARDRRAGGRHEMAVRRRVPRRHAAADAALPDRRRAARSPISTFPTRMRARSISRIRTCSRSTASPAMTGSRIRRRVHLRRRLGGRPARLLARCNRRPELSA